MNFKDPRKSRVANGTSLFAGVVDGRSAWAKRFKEIITEHVNDLGGPTNLSAAERSLIRRASALTTELERIETAFATTPNIDFELVDLYGRAAGNLRRLLESVGLKRRARDVTPSLSDYLAARGSQTTILDPEDEDASEDEAEDQAVRTRMSRPRMTILNGGGS
jgi:hypothetical protein